MQAQIEQPVAGWNADESNAMLPQAVQHIDHGKHV